VDESPPYVDARLPDGSRVNVVCSVSVLGRLSLSASSRPSTHHHDLIEFQTLTRRASDFLEAASAAV